MALPQALFQALDTFVSGSQLPFSDRNFLLQAAVLFDELSLNMGKLFKVPFEEGHLLLLGAVIRAAENIVVLLACLIQRDFEFDDL